MWLIYTGAADDDDITCTQRMMMTMMMMTMMLLMMMMMMMMMMMPAPLQERRAAACILRHACGKASHVTAFTCVCFAFVSITRACIQHNHTRTPATRTHVPSRVVIMRFTRVFVQLDPCITRPCSQAQAALDMPHSDEETLLSRLNEFAQ